jgi:hypothetical protein
VLGAWKLTICQRSTLAAGLPSFHSSCIFQNGGGSTSRIQRVTVAELGPWVTSKGTSAIAR